MDNEQQDRVPEQLLDYLDQPDIVDWVKDHTTYVPNPGMRN